MNLCEEISTQITFYLDDELHGDERATFEAHLAICAACRTQLEIEKQFIESLRQSRPLYVAPPDLRARVAETLSDSPEPLIASPQLRAKLQRSLAGKPLSPSESSRKFWLALAAAVVLVAGATWWMTTGRSRTTPEIQPLSEFAFMAVTTHQRYLQGKLPLEIASESPERISGWFEGKVPFRLTLPNYQELSGQERLYNLEGARLVGFKNDYAAYVAYQMGKRPIGLVVAGDNVVQPSGGELIWSNGLTFHYDTLDGLKVITWSDRGLTYALVSDMEERGQRSCLVCHVGTKDRHFIEGFTEVK